MLPEIHILGLSIKSFGLMIAVALLASLVLLVRRIEEVGKPRAWATEGAFLAVIGGIVGARLLWNIQNRGVEDLLSGGGLIWYGGLVGGAVVVILWSRLRGIPFLFLLDLYAPVLAVSYTIGRIGCQLSGDGDYGVASDLPWAMGYPDGTVPTPPGVEVHPTPVYEAVMMGVAAVWLWRRRDAFRPGVLFAAYLVIAGVERFVVEFVRRNPEVVAGLTAAQLQSVALAAAGALAAALLVRQRTPQARGV